MMKLNFSLIVSICIGFSSIAQKDPLMKAKEYSKNLAYSQAIPIYESFSKESTLDVISSLDLAECYFKTFSYQKAETLYATTLDTIDQSLIRPKDIFNYAMTLRSIGNTDESNRWMEKYSNGFKPSLISDEAHFDITLADFNSIHSDFGATTFKNAVFFLSSRNDKMFNWTYGWDNEGFLDIYTLRPDDSTSSPKKFKSKANSKFHEGSMDFTKDGKRVYFTRNNLNKKNERRDSSGIQNLQLFTALISETGDWIDIKALNINSKEYSTGHPSISADGKQLYFASDMPGGFGGPDLYVAKIENDGELSNITNLGSQINTSGREMFPSIYKDLLFYSSDGLNGIGGLDIFIAKNDEQKFSDVRHCGQVINSAYDDFGIAFSSENTGYFSSNRPNGKGSDDIYEFTQIRPFVFDMFISGTIRSSKNQLPLKDAILLIKDKNGEIIEEIATDENGYYSVKLNPNSTYTVEISSLNHITSEDNISLSPNEKTKTFDFELAAKPEFGLVCKIMDENSKIPLKEVQITVADQDGEIKYIDASTDESGSVSKELKSVKIGDVLRLSVQITKDGYLSINENIFIEITEEGVIDLNKYLKTSMSKMKLGADLGKIFDINPIYFDLGKYNIRKDASVELDKIVKIMNENPTMVIELGSHTDCRGSASSNERLSSKRANSSVNYIKKKITNPERISGKGYGESKLEVDCPCEGAVRSDCSEAEHQKNRRTEFIIKGN